MKKLLSLLVALALSTSPALALYGGTVNQGAAAASGPWLFTPWLAGAVVSATNGIYTNLLQGNAVLSATNTLFVQLSNGTTAVSPAIAGNQPTNASQGSTTSGQTGTLIEGAVTTSAPTYTTGQTDPLSLDTAGNVRVNCTVGCAGGVNTVVAQTPTVQNAAYANNNSIGAYSTYAVLNGATFSGSINSLVLTSKGGLTGAITVILYRKAPASTCTDKNAYSENSTDEQYILNKITMVPTAVAGATQTFANWLGYIPVLNADSGQTANVYACLVNTSGGNQTPGSTTDVTLAIGAIAP
jgi:hypothetical protein